MPIIKKRYRSADAGILGLQLIRLAGGVIVLLTVLLLIFWAIAVQAQIAGSPHDFSGNSWSGNRICQPCHTPHNARPVNQAPLWNHEVTTATYTLYSSPTMDVTVEQPGEMSKLCLSCHDGTTAMDAFGSNAGSTYMTGPKAVGRGLDLSDDHPVGILWQHQTVATCTQSCHFGGPNHDPYSYEVRFYDKRVECATCHEPHNNGPENYRMLRVSMAGSELCLLCHNDK